MRRTLTWILTFALVWSATSRASAFTTRVHIALSNEIREALIASPDGRTIRLRWSDHSVTLPQEDADAIVNQPLAFRAGAVGPDNIVFPAMTDGTHGVTQDPYRQCELLYVEALTEVERAYALGCFLHGSTDAIAHHFVNYFTGETFTLNPISASRASDYDNVIGHITTESVIQSALHEADPTALSGTSLEHSIPQDFVLRTYFDVDSPVWERMAEEPLVKWEAARAADPDGTVLTWAQGAGFAPWEQIAMAPVYIAELQLLREELRATMVARIAELGTDPELGVTPGPDGMPGTPDDQTACSASCASKFGEYYVLVRLLAPRMDAAGRPLPSAFDKISEDLGDDLYGFLPALVQVIANLSSELNAPVPPSDTSDHGLDITPATIATVFGPVDDWADRTFAIDYETVGRAVSPTWYTDLSDFFSGLGVSVSIPDIMRALLDPIVSQIRDALVNEVRDRAVTFLDELTSAYRARFGGWRTDVAAGLDASSPPGLGGHALDHAADSGLFVYSFNITAAVLASHELVLVAGEPIPSGPSSFDASYTMSWTQLGLCDYLREAVFPEGTDVRALLSVRQGETRYLAEMSEDAPVECHDGALDAFGAPSRETCEHTDLDTLLSSRRGSLTRAYPPDFASGAAGCRDLRVPGLPDPPPRPDAGPGGELDGGVVMPGTDGGGMGGETTGGCCSVAPGAPGGSASGALAVMALAMLGAWRRRRRGGLAIRAVAIGVGVGIAALVVLAGCGEPMPAETDAAMLDGGGTPGDDAGGGDDDAGGGDDDAGPEVDAGPDLRRDFLDTLDGTVWSGLQTRDEGGAAVRRAYEMRFRSSDLFWGEVRNPFGPARQRILRQFRIDRGACADAFRCDASSTIMIPTGWETPEPLRGERETWTFELIDGSPRALAITNSDGIEEIFTEGAWPAPTTGLTAEVRVFGSTGPVFDAYCGAGAGSWSRSPIWDFARGSSGTLPLRTDVVAGARVLEWRNGVGTFAVSDIDGFSREGGTLLTDQANFVARFHGTVAHTGHLSIRELNDDVDIAAAWVFTGSNVGSGPVGSELFEIFSYFGDDDEVVTQAGLSGAGDLPVEVIVVWCAASGAEPFTLQGSLTSASGPWQIFGDIPSRPVIDETLFPPVL